MHRTPQMNSSTSIKLFCMALGVTFMCQAQEMPSQHFDLVKLTDGVYAAIETPGGSAVSNAGIVDLGDAALVFDTFMSLQVAKELAGVVEKLLRKPVRYVVNSHYHKDHIWGNQVFVPGATIISSRWTRDALLGSKVPDIGNEVKEISDKIADLRSKAASEKDPKEKKEILLS
ncbi:MAG: MBL fold metallo-hydrolase, partial [Ignavibacteria bacterium]|nr:MBL fold metallo-hydrolase [Ignavibacteria bacterium]